jgi:hypothetical protein
VDAKWVCQTVGVALGEKGERKTQFKFPQTLGTAQVKEKRKKVREEN